MSNDSNKSEENKARTTVSDLRKLLGDNTVFLKVQPGEKRPLDKGWRDLTVSDMTPQFLAELERYNVGISLGKASSGLCTIDVDSDVALEAFLEMNPKLKETLQSKRARGGNIWVRVSGVFPELKKIQTRDKKPWGEWRADGGQTVILGSAKSNKGDNDSVPYRITHRAEPIEIEFTEINWPGDLVLPWSSEPRMEGPIPETNGGDFIILPGGDVTFSDCGANLFRRIALQKKMFVRCGTVVEEESDKQTGIVSLSVVSASEFRSRMEDYGKLVVWRVGADGTPVLKPTNCPVETAQGLLDTTAAREHLPAISSILRCPVMIECHEDLNILGKGYHEENGGILITAGEPPEEVELPVAVKALNDLLSEFDFQTPGDKARALASFITPALKMGGFITGSIPVDVAEADQSQSGKTYRQRVVAAIYNEVPAMVVARNGGVGSVDESFAQRLVAGRPFIQLDNVRGRMDSQFIESFLTADGPFAARVPHRGDVNIDPSRFFLFMSSNGVDTSRDFANRSSIIRIRKRVGYDYRTYPEGDLLAHVRAKQPFYLGCIFAVIREWVENGKPQTKTCDHDFRGWARILGWIVENIFDSAPLMEGHLKAQERVSNPSLTFLRQVAVEVRKESKLDQVIAANVIVDLCQEAGLEIPGCKYGSAEQASRQVGLLLRRVFSETDSVEIDDFVVSRREFRQRRSDGGGDYTSKCYVFNQRETRTTAQVAQVDIDPTKLPDFLESIEPCAACADCEQEEELAA